MGRLALVRHGQSEGNRAGIITGQIDSPLTQEGMRQARCAALAIRSAGLRVERMVTSHLLRACTSEKIIAHELGLSRRQIHRSRNFNERDFGRWQGCRWRDLQHEFGADWPRMWKEAGRTAPPGGETLERLKRRVQSSYETSVWPYLNRGDKGQDVVVVLHTAVLLIVMSLVEGVPAEEMMESTPLNNAEPILYTFSSPLSSPIRSSLALAA
jgi:2,3-bisphosphoglycerate-dependent phosphoglycerate mutase